MNHNSDDEQALKKIQHQWADARLKRDSSFATQIEADDFTVVWPDGQIINKQGDVKLLNLTAKAKDLLQMTKLLTVFDVYDDEAKALAALKGSKTSA